MSRSNRFFTWKVSSASDCISKAACLVISMIVETILISSICPRNCSKLVKENIIFGSGNNQIFREERAFIEIERERWYLGSNDYFLFQENSEHIASKETHFWHFKSVFL